MLNQYFKKKEFACKCGCGQSDISDELLAVLTDVREHFGKYVIINSGNRCHAHNKRVGGSKNSTHLKGIASDIVVKGVNPSEVHKYLTEKYPDSYGIGKYPNFTHIDVRDYKARW
ncbi:D-Ala-D-Ala carboxypeptidase family metallohydrolase [Proteus columbae]|uniref:D-Ala-D-Ala carboxypeptidase family metallohydrolase n=1 Tax=Proteus columbae TaxID=1987580 RepID=UPI00288C12F1|nr:D-Ala-D-Ala carboxypeptidase family metallohydrolase [Proteus columbae]